MELLCEIEDVLDCEDNGCLVSPGIPDVFPNDVQTGAAILVQPPVGKPFKTFIEGLALINRREFPSTHTPFFMPREIGMKQLSQGTKVYLLAEAA